MRIKHQHLRVRSLDTFVESGLKAQARTFSLKLKEEVRAKSALGWLADY
jgi:hypothetical protein